MLSQRHCGTRRNTSNQSPHPNSQADIVNYPEVLITHTQHHSCSPPCLCASVRKTFALTEALRHKEKHIETITTPKFTGGYCQSLCSPHHSYTTSFLFPSVPLCLREKNVAKFICSHRGTEAQREPHQNNYYAQLHRPMRPLTLQSSSLIHNVIPVPLRASEPP